MSVPALSIAANPNGYNALQGAPDQPAPPARPLSAAAEALKAQGRFNIGPLAPGGAAPGLEVLANEAINGQQPAAPTQTSSLTDKLILRPVKGVLTGIGTAAGTITGSTRALTSGVWSAVSTGFNHQMEKFKGKSTPNQKTPLMQGASSTAGQSAVANAEEESKSTKAQFKRLIRAEIKPDIWCKRDPITCKINPNIICLRGCEYSGCASEGVDCSNPAVGAFVSSSGDCCCYNEENNQRLHGNDPESCPMICSMGEDCTTGRKVAAAANICFCAGDCIGSYRDAQRIQRVLKNPNYSDVKTGLIEAHLAAPASEAMDV